MTVSVDEVECAVSPHPAQKSPVLELHLIGMFDFIWHLKTQASLKYSYAQL